MKGLMAQTSGSARWRSLRGGHWASCLLASGLLAVLGFCFIACEKSGSDHSLERLQRDGVIRIGYAVEAPYAFLTPDGNVTGEAPEIAREIVHRLKINRIEWRLTEFSSLIDGLESHRFDVIAAGMFITPERAKRVAFSHPTYQAGSALLVAKNNPRHLRSYRDAATNENVRLAVISDAVEERELLRLGISSERLIRVPDALSGEVMVREGKVDALALTAPTVRWMAQKQEAFLECVEIKTNSGDHEAIFPIGAGAFVFRQSDVALRQAWDRELSQFIGSQEHQQLVASFGFTIEELPEGVGEKNHLSSP